MTDDLRRVFRRESKASSFLDEGDVEEGEESKTQIQDLYWTGRTKSRMKTQMAGERRRRRSLEGLGLRRLRL